MMTTIASKILANLIMFALCTQMCYGSAIPIWEFLSRNEKMSHLYSTFAQLVSSHCKTNAASETLVIPVNQCKRNLLNYGYEKLQALSDLELDTFDPYQRGANELIWSSIMRGHPDIRFPTTAKPIPTAPVTSLIILTQSQSAPNVGQDRPNFAASTPSPYPSNPIFNIDTEHKHTYAMDMDIAYGYSLSSNPLQVETFIPSQSGEQTYLSGPLVFRVRPDGTPVEEDKHKPLPRDDDLEAFQLTKQNRVADNIKSKKERHLATLTLQHLLPPQQQQSPALLQRSRRQFKVVNKSVGDNLLLPVQPTNYYQSRKQISV